MILEILMGIQLVMMYRLIKAVHGPNLMPMRRKRISLLIERISNNVTNFTRSVRSTFRKGR